MQQCPRESSRGVVWSEGQSQYLLAKDSTLVLFLTRCRGAAVFPTSV